MLLADFAQFQDVCYAFLSIVLEGAFFIFIGTLISGFIDAYLPPGLIDRWLPKNKYLAVLLSGLLGAVFPVCECAIVPVIRRLVKKGLPLACAITYMLSAPIINPVVFFSTWSAFTTERGEGRQAPTELRVTDAGTAAVEAPAAAGVGAGIGEGAFVPDPWYMAISRVLIAYLITVGVGFVILKIPVGAILKKTMLAGITKPRDPDHNHGHDHDDDDEHEHEHEHDHGGNTQGQKLIHAMNVAQRDFRDVAIYFVVGVALTAMFTVLVNQAKWIEPWAGNNWFAAPAMMVLAFVLSLCSTSDAFLAATFPSAFQAGPRLAFLVYGPMIDVKLLFMYSSVFRKRFVLSLAMGLFIIVGVVCTLWGGAS